jgi:hypothetical protein
MGQLYACMVPSDWWSPNNQAQSGCNLAHELGHVLGLQHRGSGDSNTPPRSEDLINAPDTKSKLRGHPWHENVMTYGYGGNAARGDAFWRTRVELANQWPGARVVLFSDLGRAGPREQLSFAKPLAGVGVGASFIDGLIRVDLSRSLRAPKGWRLDFYTDAAL